MKTIKSNLIIFLGGLLILSSCVSSKKYNEAQMELKRYKEMASASDKKNIRLQQLNDSLTSTYSKAQRMSDENLSLLNIEKMRLQQINDSLITHYTSVQEKSGASLRKTEKELMRDRKALSDLQKAVTMAENEISNIREELCSALKCFTPEEVTVQEKDGELYVSMYDKLLFPVGSDKVNLRGKKALKILSQVLRKNKMKIMVEGHTDSIPIHNERFNDNWDLSVNRATSVIRVLTKEDKLDPSRIVAAGKGKFQPFYSNKTADGRRLNRRTDIVLVPKLENLYSLINQNTNHKSSGTAQ